MIKRNIKVIKTYLKRDESFNEALQSVFNKRNKKRNGRVEFCRIFGRGEANNNRFLRSVFAPPVEFSSIVIREMTGTNLSNRLRTKDCR